MKLIMLFLLTTLFTGNVLAAQWKLFYEVDAGNFKKLCVYSAISGSSELMTVEQKKGVVCRLYI